MSRKLDRVSFMLLIDTASWSTSRIGERPLAGWAKSKRRMACASCTRLRSGLTTRREVSQPSGRHSSRVVRVISAPCQRMR